MFSNILFLAVSAVGINYGWEPLPEGGMKYIVQFDPQSLETAQKADEPLESNIPANIGDVRIISIRLGTGQVPRTDPPAKTEQAERAIKPEPSALPPLLQNPQGRPLATQVAYNEQSEKTKTDKATNVATANLTADKLAKPWPMIGILILLFASLGGNAYLLWIFAELRKRYRALLGTASK